MATDTNRLSLDEVKERVEDLRQLHAPVIPDRVRTQELMDGGAAGVRALLGPDIDIGTETDMPASHLLHSGIERLAQKLSFVPDVRVLPPDDRDKKDPKERAAKLERICAGYDEVGRLELSMLQQARWVPGYGFGVWVIEEIEAGGQKFPAARLRNPRNTYPGHWGVDGQPQEFAAIRSVPARKLRKTYPEHASKINDERMATGTIFAVSEMGQVWESPGQAQGYTVIDYYDNSGTYVYIDELELLLDYVPNPLEKPRFVVPHRPSFNALIGQFRHILGTMAMMAKLNVLSAAAMEDAVNTETNIFGQLRSPKYKRGRFSVNELEVSARVEKPINNMPYQLFEQIDRLERQIRLTAGYPITDDAESPNSFVTGRGLEELGASASRIVTEYQQIFKWALQDLDSMRLEWDETFYGSKRKSLFGERNGIPFAESYVPEKAINGVRRSQRVYGMMAGWDDATKIITGIQLLEAGVIDIETFQENLKGLDNIPRINRRIRKKSVEAQMLAALGQRFAAGDPRAAMTLVNIYVNPDDMEEELKRFHTPDEPLMSPEQQALVGAASGGRGGPIPDVTTALSRINMDGADTEVGAGVQTVRARRNPPRR